MSKRLQIPVSESDGSYFQEAARRSGLPLAEWARRHLREKASETLHLHKLSPHQALAELKLLDAPAGPVAAMIEESLRGRYS